jgi:DHA1 family inner membrane transport protein
LFACHTIVDKLALMNPAPQSPPLALFSIANLVIGTGAFIIAGMAVAGVAIDQRGKALSVVFLGISLSYVVGLPLGTWLTSMHSWRLPVQLVALSSLVILAVLMWRLPGHQAAPPVTFKGAGALLRQGAVAWPLVLTLLYFTAIFVVFGYIGPVLQALGPLSVAQASVTLFLFGL